MRYILSVDQGTTSSRAILYNEKFEIIGIGQKEFQQHYPQAGWVEHDMLEIWESVLSSLKQALHSVEDVNFDPKKIVAIGITNQRETFGLWEKESVMPVHPAIVWQCRRSASICNKLSKTSKGKKLRSITGLVLDPYFSGTKLKWLLDQNLKLKRRAEKGDLAFGTMDTFLIAKLSGGKSHVTDTSNASRTMMMDLKTCQWSSVALETLGVPKALLPEIKSSNALFGHTRGLGILPDGIPIHGVLGDQQSALFGQACFKAGEAKVTYGTGAFLLLNTGRKIKKSHNALSTVAWTLDGQTQYAMEGSVFIAGAAVQWLRDNLELFDESADIEALAMLVENNDGVYFIPALSGLGSPYWAPYAKGIIGGLTRRSQKAHVARACLEAIAQSIADQLEAIREDAELQLLSIKVDGGASKNKLLLQIQSDLLQSKVCRPRDIESTARGAAFMASLGAGVCKSLNDLVEKNPMDIEFSPQVSRKVSRLERELWKKRMSALLKAAPYL